MHGYGKSYRELLDLSECQMLGERRNEAIIKFSKKTAKAQTIATCPPPPVHTIQDNSEVQRPPWKNMFALKNHSPLFKYRRLLNDLPDSLEINADSQKLTCTICLTTPLTNDSLHKTTILSILSYSSCFEFQSDLWTKQTYIFVCSANEEGWRGTHGLLMR